MDTRYTCYFSEIRRLWLSDSFSSLCSSFHALPSPAERFRQAWRTPESATVHASMLALPSPQERWAEQQTLARKAHGPHPPEEASHAPCNEGHRHVPVKPVELVNEDNIAESLSSPCCQKRCLTSWLVEDVLVFRRQIAKRNEAERLSYLLTILSLSPKSASGYHAYQLQTAACTYSVCRKALLAVLGISSGKLDHALHLEKLGLHSPPPHGNVERRDDELATQCESWWRQYSADLCDQISAKKVLTPASETFHDEYMEFALEQKVLGVAVPSEALFNSVRLKLVPKIQHPAHTELATCDKCDQHVLRLKTVQTADEKLAVLADKHAHLRIAHREREHMQENMRFALRHPAELLMVFADYSSSLKLPHFRRTPTVDVLARAAGLTVCAGIATAASASSSNLWHDQRDDTETHALVAPATI